MIKPNNELVSIILPTYNEKGNIIQLIQAIQSELKSINYEIIVVDDNSPDDTYNVVKEANLNHTRAILRTIDKGFAKSIRCGIENSSGSRIIIMDSDFNHQPKYLPFMIQSLDFYQCVTASRFVYGGSMENKLRHILSHLFNLFVRVMTGTQITDSLYGYLAIRKEIFENIKFDEVFWGYGDYCIRLMYFFQKNKNDILQYPAINGKRLSGDGNSNFFKVFKLYFKAVIKLTYKIRI